MLANAWKASLNINGFVKNHHDEVTLCDKIEINDGVKKIK